MMVPSESWCGQARQFAVQQAMGPDYWIVLAPWMPISVEITLRLM